MRRKSTVSIVLLGLVLASPALSETGERVQVSDAAREAPASPAGDLPPVCFGAPDFFSVPRIETNAEDSGVQAGFGGLQLAAGSVNLAIGTSGPGPVGVTVGVAPIDPTLEATGGVVFTDLGGQSCDVAVRFQLDQVNLCSDDGVTLDLEDGGVYRIGGVCDGGVNAGLDCTANVDCEPGGFCSDVCRGGVNGGLPCTDDLQCPSGFCSRRTAECSLNVPAPIDPQLPPGFEQSPLCRIMSLRVPPVFPDLGSGTPFELVKQGDFESNLRLMVSFYDDVAMEYPDFKDVTSEVEALCEVPVSQSEVPVSATRDKGQGDVGGGSGGFPPLGPGGPMLPGRAKVTCANFVGIDCGTVPDPGQDFDGDTFPLCALGSIVDCNDANPNINPGMPEICNGVDDNCDGVLADSDFDGVEDCFDCDPFDGTAWKAPGVQPTNLLLDQIDPATTLLAWTAPPFACGGGSTYDTIASPVAFDFTLASCSNGVGTSSTDTTSPAAGEVVYFLVRAANSCGVGPVANRSDGTPRAVSCL